MDRDHSMARFSTQVAALFALVAATAAAQEYPARPLRVVVPYAPGGPVDIVTRITSQKLAEALGQQVIVENRAGAGGNIAVEFVARAAPDGYTLLMGANGTNAINPSLYKKLPVDPEQDLAPVSKVASSAMILVVHPSLPVTSVKQLVALARSRPGAINYASAGSGSTAHLASELLKTMAKIDLLHVPYKGAGPALTDLVAGQVQAMITAISTTLPYLRAGRLKALAVSSEKRSPLLPELPAVAEQLPGYEVTTWYGVFAPAATPRPVVEKLNQALVRVLATPDARGRFAAVGADAEATTPEQFAQSVRKERAKWAKIIQDSGARAE
jgi:tripartite-type tricarboxylate transporter receptor subunit TctC